MGTAGAEHETRVAARVEGDEVGEGAALQESRNPYQCPSSGPCCGGKGRWRESRRRDNWTKGMISDGFQVQFKGIAVPRAHSTTETTKTLLASCSALKKSPVEL